MSTSPENLSKNKSLPPPLSLRLTFEERAALEQTAENSPLGVYIRAKLFGGTQAPRRVRTRTRKPLKVDENEHVEVHELRGFMADNLPSAFNEIHAISTGTRAKQPFFSLSLNPPSQERVPIEVFETTIEQIEQKLGLDEPPRAIVFHEKEGRRHASENR